MAKDYTINSGDLNRVEFMNGTGTIDYKGFPPNIKGAGSILNEPNRSNQTNGKNYALGGWVNNQLLFLSQMWNRLHASIAEFFIYTGLPIDNYRFEKALQRNGALACIKVGDEYGFYDYTVEESDRWETPLKIKIKMPTGERTFNEGEFTLVRNNLGCEPTTVQSERLILAMEQALYEIQNNLKTSRPKGLIDLTGAKLLAPNNNDVVDLMESIMDSDRTFHPLVTDMTNFNVAASGNVRKEPFTAIQFADRSEFLIKQYNFFKEQLKEYFGFGIDPLVDKKERKNEIEMSNQQKLSNAAIMHMFNIRKQDLELCNEKLGTRFNIEKNEEMWHGEMSEGEGEIIDEGDN